MKLQFQDRLDCPHSYNTEDNKNLQCDYSFCEICDGTLYEHCLWDMDESVIERCEDDKLKPTGRHFEEISQLLDMLRGEE